MYSKIASLCILIGFCQAGVLLNEGHGQAFSSQSVVRHPQPYQLSNNYPSSVLQQSAPLFQAAAPIVQQPTSSILQHRVPVVQQTPVVQQYSSVLPHPSVSPVVQHAPIVQQVAPIAKVVAPIGYGQEDHYEVPAKYEFSYSVEDPHSGDQKSQHEIRDGDVVRGEYSLLQPDGSVRKVEYNADDHNGFSATVHNSAPSGYAAPANAQAPAFTQAPVFAHAPVVAQTPIAAQSPIYAVRH